MKKLTIYLGDLRYFIGGTCFPLGLGYLTAYARQQLGDVIDIRIFIDPTKLIDAIRTQAPDVLGLANYTWNRNINTQVVQLAKSVSSKTTTLMGGPCFARDDEPWLEHFFERNGSLDFYPSGGGEFTFVEMLRLKLSAGGADISKARECLPSGVFFRDEDKVLEGVLAGGQHGRLKNLDILPSPYLSGVLDEFFNYPNLGPMIETVRGCPYACTFCCWGSRLLNKVSSFSLERVRAELDYIASRSGNCRRLYFGDANFGLLEQDVEVARHLHDIRKNSGWPDDVYLYLAKNSGCRVIDIARFLKGMTKVSLARQSLSEPVLKNMRRANLGDEDFIRVQRELGESQIESMVEIIYPLPGETRQSFIEGINQVFHQMDLKNTEIRLYPTELLPGSEMASTQSRQRFGLKTGWRKLWGQSGCFSGVTSCEYQEIVVATNDFSLEDQAYVRKLHFLFTLFLTYRLFEPVTLLFVRYYPDKGVMSLILPIIERMGQDGLLAYLIEKFERDTNGEFLFGNEPTANGVDERRSGKQEIEGSRAAKRFNIYYALELFYGNDGKWLKAFLEIMRKVLVAAPLAIPTGEVDDAIRAITTNIVDYPLIADGRWDGELADHPSVKAFVAIDHAVVVDALYSLYSIVTGGHLDRMVLKRPFPGQ